MGGRRRGDRGPHRPVPVDGSAGGQPLPPVPNDFFVKVTPVPIDVELTIPSEADLHKLYPFLERLARKIETMKEKKLPKIVIAKETFKYDRSVEAGAGGELCKQKASQTAEQTMHAQISAPEPIH